MTVQELINKLQDMPIDAIIIVDGNYDKASDIFFSDNMQGVIIS